MRLLNTRKLKFKEFFQPPPYAILSHRWGTDEISFDSYMSGQILGGPGYHKILSCCQFASRRGREWVWIDTCCIDKRSSAELSEAINSMWEWYGKAQECYAYLLDVRSSPTRGHFDTKVGEPSAWFSRGWTLQELLAPRVVIFCDKNWRVIGQKQDREILEEITKITSIPLRCLASHFALSHASVAQKLSWASRRVTTRAEDIAYCLLGLVGVNMPLLYGEGNKAFLRLQQEIIRQTDDESIFAWCDPTVTLGHVSGILAPSIEHFADSGHVGVVEGYRKPYAVTNKGLDFDVPCHHVKNQNVYIIPLNCQYRSKSGPLMRCAIAVQEERDQFSPSFRIHVNDLGAHLLKRYPFEERELVERRFLVRIAKWQNQYGPAIAVINNFFERMRGRKIERLVEQMRLTTSLAQDESQCQSGEGGGRSEHVAQFKYTELGLMHRNFLNSA
jgi:hypothetical protein